MSNAFQPTAFQNNAFQIDPITGVLYAVDENDTGSFVGSVTTADVTVDTHDGFTPEEVKRLKKLQKKLAIAEAQRIQSRLNKRLQRKQSIQNLVDPKPVVQVKLTKVQSDTEVKTGKPPIDLKRLNAEIARLERQKQELLYAAQVRNEMARLQMELAIYEAKLKAELDDEEALLMLL